VKEVDAGLPARFDAAEARRAAEAFDLQRLSAAFYRNPYPWYHALREHAPIKWLPDGSVFLTRYQDLVAVYKDPKGFSSDKRAEFSPKYGETPLYEHHTTSLVFNDPPYHTRVRRLIAGALTPRHVAAMEAGLVALVDRLLDAMSGQREADLIEAFAGAIPVEIIGNLLGVPRDERAPLRGWSLAILGALEPVLTTETAERGNRAVREMLEYLEGLVAERRRHPGDPDTDVLTRLIVGEQDGERLTQRELLHNCIFLLNAGHETTTNLIGNGLHALLEWPEEQARLVRDPGLIRLAVEEFLRFESSNQLGNRIATATIEVGGVTLPAGTRVTLCIGAANRDPAQFPDPDRLDLGRTPNRHLAFGSGPHQCVGMQVGRLEARIAIERFLARFPRFELSGTPVRGGRARFRGFLTLPVRLGS
jgi:cytochrome P450